ncbi:MAG: hypothetical protein R3C11_23515 [Planctomycetaceae bacterium]
MALLSTMDIPAGFSPERVRLEQMNSDYSWIATIRRIREPGNSIRNEIDFVCFHKRILIQDDEQLYIHPTAFEAGQPVAYLNYEDTDKPKPEKDDYVFDAERCFWYRIIDVVDDSANDQFVLTLDRNARRNSTSLMLVPQVVDVYPRKHYSEPAP